VLRGEAEDRVVYRLDRSGAVFLAFRWPVLRLLGFPGAFGRREDQVSPQDENPYGA